MAESIFRGPAFSAGCLIDGRVEPMDGPGFSYQGDAIPDIRFFPTRKDGLYPGRLPAILNSPYFVLCDNIPQAASATALVSAQNPTINTPFTLAAGAAAQANGTTAGAPTMAPGVPLVPYAPGTYPLGASYSLPAVNVLALDFGFATGTTTAGSASIPVNDATLFYQGQWICVGGAGNSGKTLPLIAQVQSISITNTTTGAGTLVMQGGALNGVAASAVTNAPIGSMNLPGPLPSTVLSGPLAYVPSSVYPFLTGGMGTFLNPPEGITRALNMVGQAGASANNITVKGYDIYGQPMTETQALNAATVVFFKKAFKYIASITPSATDGGHTINVGISDTYGYAVRADKYEYTQTFWNAAYLTAATGFAARIITPATASTGDVRGTFQTSTSASTGGGNNGIGGAGATGTSSNGSTVRLLMAVTIPLWNDLFGTPLNTVPMFGVNQA